MVVVAAVVVGVDVYNGSSLVPCVLPLAPPPCVLVVILLNIPPVPKNTTFFFDCDPSTTANAAASAWARFSCSCNISWRNDFIKAKFERISLCTCASDSCIEDKLCVRCILRCCCCSRFSLTIGECKTSFKVLLVLLVVV